MKAINRVRSILHLLVIVGMLVTSVGPAGLAQPTAQAAAPGQELSYFYDESGQLTGVVDPASDSASYSYDQVGNVRSISRKSAAQTALIEFTPNAGPIGSSVTLFGTGFSSTASQNSVSFNGVAASVTSASSTEIVVSVPAGATTGPIAVTTPAGSATSSAPFTIQSGSLAPQISSFTPTVGTAGTPVTINGANFETAIANNRVQFNGSYATLTSSTATQIQTTLPARAASGRISIATPSGRVLSTSDFFVPPSPYTAADIELTDRMALGTTKTVTINTANKIGMILFDGVQGQQVSLGISNVSVASSSVSILKPDGNTLVSTSVGTSGSFIDARTLPSDGTYTILVDPGSTYTGSMTLALYDATDLSASITAGGPSVAVTTTVPGQNARLTFTGSANQQVSIGLSGVTISNSTVSLLKPDGTALGSVSVGTSGGLLDNRTLPVAGVYTILIDPSSTNVGNMTVTLYNVPDVTAAIQANASPVTVTTTTPGQNARLTFSGALNQRISVKLSNVTLSQSYVSVLKPDGTALIGATYITTSGGYLDIATLPVAGTYTILVDGYGSAVGSMAVTLYDVPADASAAIVPGGADVTVTTTVPGQNARLTFSGAAGQRVSVKLSNVTLSQSYVSVLKPDGTALIGATYTTTSGGFLDVVTLPVAGTYTILVDGYGMAVGNMTVTLYDVPADPSSPIVPGGADVTVTTTVPGQNAKLTFSGAAGQRVSVKLSGVTLSQSYVSVLKPDGTALIGATYTTTSGGFLDVKDLPVAGTYTILVDGYGMAVGSMTVTLYDVPADLNPAIVPGGASVTVTTTVPGQNAKLTFSGAASQRISVKLSGVTLSQSYVSVLKPDGTALIGATYTTTSGGYLDVVTLPVAGTYTILVDGYGMAVGNMTVTLYDVPADVTGPIVIGGAAVPVTLSTPGQNARLTFSGTASQQLTLTIGSVTIPSSYVSVLKPDGTSLTSTSFGTSGTNLTITLPVAGTYTIVVDPQAANTGNATLTLVDAGDVTAAIVPGGASVTVTTTVPGQNAKLTFSGALNQRISVKLSGVTLSQSYVSVLKPDGTTLIGATYISTSGGFLDVATLPVAGTYTILIDPSSTNVGSMTVTLYDVPADVSPTIVPGGAAVPVTLGTPGQNARLTFSGTVGQQVSLNVSGVTIPSSYVSILKPDGTTLTSTSFGTSGAFLDMQRLTVAGTYTVLVDPQAANTGNATVTLYNASDVTTSITASTPVTVTTTVPGQNAKLTFSGTAGQRISVKLSGVTLSQSYVSVLKPDGTALIGATYINTSGGFLDVATLPVAGTYTILVDGSGAAVGNMTVTLYDVPADISPAIVLGGADVVVTTTVPGQNARLTFTGALNQRISVKLSGVTLSQSYVSVLKPDGTALIGATYINTSGGYLDVATLPVAGTYTILIDPSSTNVGSMTVTLYDVPADVSPTIVAGGADVAVTTTVPGQNARLTFSGALNQRISVKLSNVTLSQSYVSVLKPDGTALIGATYINTSGGFLDIKALPVAGTYTILVDGSGAAVGSMTVTLYDVPADVSPTIVAGGADVAVTTSVPGQNARLTFTGALNQRISVKLSGVTLSQSYVSVLKPDGTALIGATYINTSGGFLDIATLPVAGTYTILVDGSGMAVGNMTVTLYDVPADASSPIVPGGADATVTTTVPGQNAKLTFSGAAGQRISVKLSGVTLSQSYVSVLKPDGTALIGATYTTTSGGYLDVKALPVAGTYTILVDGYGMAVGSMTVTLYDVPADVSPAIVAGGADVAVTTTVPGQNAKLTFSGANGQRVSVKLSGVTLSQSYVSVLKPDGTTLIGATYITTSGGYLDVATLPVAGTYTILVDGYGMAVGNMTVTLYDVPADATGSLVLGGAAVAVTTTVPGQNARLTFDGTASQRINLALTSVTIPASYVSILKPDGTTLVGATYISTSGGTLSPTLPVAGTYTVVVDPNAANTGSMTLRLTLFGASTVGPKLAQAQPPSAQQQRVALSGAQQLGAPAAQADDESWTPDPRNLRNWTTGRPRSTWQDLAPLQARPGVTGLAGQVLNLKGEPLANVTLEIDEHEVTTDQSGRFLFAPLEPGRHELEIDGSSANKPGRSYGYFETSVEVTEGYTNILPYTIWLTKLDTAHTIKVSSPLAADVVLTTPFIPGLEVRIPKGAVITGEDGKPVTELGITPIPTDRPPFPLPQNVYVPIYFTIQPGGAYVKPFARIIYPNYNNEPVGQRISFFHYEPEDMGWFVYGQGRVLPGGKQIEPDPGVGIYEFTGAMIGTGGNPPGDGPNPGGDDDGDPVDLSTGMFVMSKADMVVADPLPIVLTRTYRPGDTVSRPFGIGSTHPYHMFLWSARQYQELDLIQPDGGRIHYVRISAGTGYTDAVFEHVGSGTLYHKSIVRWNGNSGWDLVLKDGTTYTFPQYSPLQSIRDRHGNRITITRAGGTTGNITQIQSSTGRWLEFSYDTSDRVTQIKDNIGRIVSYTYDAGGRLWKVTDPGGGVTEYTYDASNRMLTIKDPRAITYLTNVYDASGRISKQTQADGTTYLFSYTLDANGKVTQTDVTDPRGIVRRLTFNASGHTLTDTYAQGRPEAQTISYQYEAGTDLPLSITDAVGRKTAYTYDAQGNLTSVTRLSGTTGAVTTRMTYDSRFNQVSSVSDPLNHTSTFQYDASGNMIAVTDPLGRRATMTYNPAGQVLTITDPLGHVTRLSYDAGDFVGVTDRLGRSTTRFVDSAGRPVLLKNPLGQAVRYDYNARSLPIKETDPLGAITQYEYDANGNLTALTDARANVTRYAYDNMDRLTTRTDPLLKVERYVYDAGGNITQLTDRKGQVTSYRYDALGRQTFVGFGTTGTASNPRYDSSLSYTYNTANLLTKISDSISGDISYTYDGLNQLLTETSTRGTVSYSYDAASRLSSMQVAGQTAVGYSYDDANRLTRIAQGPTTVNYSYDDANRLISMALPTGVSMGYSYDDAGQLTATSYKLGATELGNLSYAYDLAGRLKKLGGSYARTGLPQAISSATYDAANRLTQWGTRTLSYDANGNLTGDGTNTYTWNTRNQLTAISATGLSASFQYDAIGRRINRTLNGASTGFLYDGANAVQELSGTTPSANMLTGRSIDQTYTRNDAAGTRALLTDRLGSALALVDSSGTVQTQYTYDPFGNTAASGAASANKTQFTGRENDGTGLYFYRARYYSPTFQRFISEDPLGFAGGDVNLYAYVGNNPTNFVDPSGMIIDTIIDVISIGYDIYKLATDGRKNLGENLGALGLDVAGALIPFATGLGAAGRAAAHADDAYDALRAGSHVCSFSGDTPVATADGPQPIDQVAPGDQVLAYDEQTGTTGSYTVSAVWSHEDAVVERLTIDGEQLTTTPDHPFFRLTDGWTPAGQLQAGDQVRTASGSGTVEAIGFEHGAQPMYNLTVDHAHTYYVGDEQALVHNSCPIKPSTLAPGPHAGESIPARGPGRDFTPQERADINRIGQDTGCHTCGATDPGTKSGNHIPDHQPPNQLNPNNDPQRLYPHCIHCSRRQGGEIRAEQTRGGP